MNVTLIIIFYYLWTSGIYVHYYLILCNNVMEIFELDKLWSGIFCQWYSCLCLPLLISTWFLKNQFGKNKFNKLDFYAFSNLIFTASVAFKNQFWNWFLKAKNPVRRNWFFKNQVQINRGLRMFKGKSAFQSLEPRKPSFYLE